jgi:RNA polymerase sigma-70 factor, ECF subfamily
MNHDSNSNFDVAPILKAASRGDGAAWERLVALYSRRIYALAKSRCKRHDVAEEITQSVLVTMATKLGGGQYREEGKFEPWLFRMAMNRVRDHVRREKRRPEELELMDDDGARGHAAPRHEAVDGAELDRLRTAMTRLTDSDREIVELRHHGQMNFKDMAELLEEPMGTLLARHHRALKKLKELMDQSEQGGTKAGSKVGT